MKYEAAGCISIKKLKKECEIDDNMSCHSRTVGSEGMIYLLFAEDHHILKSNYTLKYNYAVIRILPDWYCGDIIAYEYIPLSEYTEKLYSAHPFGNDIILIGQNRKGDIGIILNSEHHEYRRISFAPYAAYNKTLVTDDKTIIMGMYDEYCLRRSSPIHIFDEYGNRTEVMAYHMQNIVDVIAMNLDEHNDLWYNAYPDYIFYCTDGRSLQSGSNTMTTAFAVLPCNKGIIAEEYGGFRLYRFNGQTENVFFTYGGNPILPDASSFMQNKAAISSGDTLYFIEIL